MLALTLDVDWAPDPVVDDVVRLFDDAGIPLTIFATDPATDRSGRSSSLRGRYDTRHEIALHPNFADGADPLLVFDNIMHHYPEARGFRSHHGHEGWPISYRADDVSLDYHVLSTPFPVDVPPFVCPGGLRHRVLVNRFVDMAMWHVPGFDWTLGRTWLDMINGGDDDSLFIAAFHPVPVCYDIVTADEYERFRPQYHEAPPRGRVHVPVGPAKLVRELLATVDPARCVTISDYLRRQE